MIRLIIDQDPIEYLQDKEGVVFNFLEPEKSYRIPEGTPNPLEDLQDVVKLIKNGVKVYIPFANLLIGDGKVDPQFLSFILQNYATLIKHDLYLITNVKNIPKEIEQYLVMEEESPPGEEEIKQILLQTFRDVQDRAPEPSEEQQIRKLAKRLTGLTKAETRNIAMDSLRKFGTYNEQFMIKAKLTNIKKRTNLEYEEPEITLDDIGGNEILKNYIVTMKETMNEEAEKFGIRPPRGLLLLGPQGTAKSTIPKAIANYLEVPLVKFRIGAFMSKYYGETENQIYRVLKTIDAIGRCVVHIDEIDKVLKRSTDTTSHEATSRVAGTLMEWMAEKKGYTPVIMTGNYIHNIDTDFTRAGRIDTIFWTWFPKFEERIEIWKIHLRKVGRDPKDFDLEKLARESRFYTGSEIETAIQLALRKAFTQKTDLNTELIIRMLKKTIVPIYMKEQEKFDSLFHSLKNFVPTSSMKDSDTIPGHYVETFARR